MIEDLDRHKSTKFTLEEMVVDKAFRSPFFDNLEETHGAYEIKEFKLTVTMKRPCQCCCVSTGQVVNVRVLL